MVFTNVSRIIASDASSFVISNKKISDISVLIDVISDGVHAIVIKTNP